jgi:hypothetical protein
VCLFLFCTCFGWLCVHHHSTLHTRQSTTQNSKYQMSHKHSCVFWWWAHIRPKHVEIRNTHTKKNCAQSWLYLQDYTSISNAAVGNAIVPLLIIVQNKNHCQDLRLKRAYVPPSLTSDETVNARGSSRKCRPFGHNKYKRNKYLKRKLSYHCYRPSSSSSTQSPPTVRRLS